MGTLQEQYLRAWHHVLAAADAVDRSAWRAPSPCAGWTAGHVAGHLVDAAHQTLALLDGAAPVLPTTDPAALRRLAGDDPAARLREAADPLLARVRAEPPTDELLAMALVEPVVHGWDLAVAAGVPVRLDGDAVASLLATAEALGARLAATGMYAPALPAPGEAPAQERLLALVGRRHPRETTSGTADGR